MKTLRYGLVVAALLLLTGFAQATDFVAPSQHIIINGDEENHPIPLGELIDLSLSPIKKMPEHLVSSSFTWKVFEADGTEKRFREYKDAIIFGAGIVPKRLTVVCAVTHLYLVKSADNKITEVGTKTILLKTDLVIGNPKPPEPGPGPGPNPNPDPSPSFPDGKYKLAMLSYTLAKSKVDPADREKAAKALSSSFGGVSAAVKAGAISNFEDILKKSAESNRSALMTAGVQRDKWVPFFQELQNVLYDLYQQKKLNTSDDMADALKEIATGLEKVK